MFNYINVEARVYAHISTCLTNPRGIFAKLPLLWVYRSYSVVSM
jgi:hypothetical protein